MAYYMYVSVQEEDRIAIFSVTPKTGKLKHLGDAELKGRPAPMAIDPDQKYLFAGRRKAGDFGMTSFKIDRKNGGLSSIGSIPLEGDPVHMSIDKTGKYLLSAYYYQKTAAVHSIGDDGAISDPPVVWRETDIGAHYIQTDPANRYAFVPHIANGSLNGANAIFQFRFDAESGKLTPLSPTRTNPRELDGPRHICFHPGMDIVYSSNEQGNSVTVYNYESNKGNLHPIQTDPANRFAFVPHIAQGSLKGANAIFQFRFDAQTGSLTPLSPTRTNPREPDGPRHICFHPGMDIVYSSNEQGNSVTVYNYESNKGNLHPIQTVSTLPKGYDGQNSCSQIQITPNGEFLYAPNRGHNSIAGFRVNLNNGHLSPIAQTPTEAVPRAFSIDLRGTFLYAAGLETGKLASYRIDQESGELEPNDVYDVGKGPMWVLMAEF